MKPQTQRGTKEDQIKQYLFQAIEGSDLKALKDLSLDSLKQQAGLSQWFDDRGYNVLHAAVSAKAKNTKEEQTAIIDWLLTELEIDPNQTTRVQDNSESALHLAVRLGRTNAVDRLVQHKGIQINITNSFGETPLHYAAEGLNPTIIRILLEKKADPKIKTSNDNQSTLHKAIFKASNNFCNMHDDYNSFCSSNDKFVCAMKFLLTDDLASKTVNLTDGIRRNTVLPRYARILCMRVII